MTIKQFKVPPLLPTLLPEVGLDVASGGWPMSIFSVTTIGLSIPATVLLGRPSGVKLRRGRSWACPRVCRCPQQPPVLTPACSSWRASSAALAVTAVLFWWGFRLAVGQCPSGAHLLANFKVPSELLALTHLAHCVQYSVQTWCFEVPAGGLSPGLTPEEVACRELYEEIGGTAADLRYIGQFHTSNSISNEIAYVYLAIGVELDASHPEPTELIKVHLVPVEEALRSGICGHSPSKPSGCVRGFLRPRKPNCSHGQARDRYEFGHDLMRRAACEILSEPRRRLL